MFKLYFHLQKLSLIAIFATLIFAGNVKAETSSTEDVFYGATSTYGFVSDSVSFTTSTTEVKYPLVEPKIRVGFHKTDQKVVFTSPYVYSLIVDGEDRGIIPENEVATLHYQKGEYSLESRSLLVTSTKFIRLVPGQMDNYFSIVNLDRHLKGRQMNFNTFRGIFEYRFSPKSSLPYLINEIYLENYVAGVAETSDASHEQYIKALQIAARTYGYANISFTPATEKRMFDVYASTIDQLYLGYNFESFSPRISRFSNETRGIMVTYKGKPVPTYYFGNSNGKTKTKKSQPWLKSVEAKYDIGRKMYGHGYGMSNRDASFRASKDGWEFQKILTYYYSGVKVEKMYE